MADGNLIEPRLVVSLGRVDEQRGIHVGNEQISLGKRTTDRVVDLSPAVREWLPIFDTEFDELPTIFSPDDAPFPDFRSQNRRV